MLIISLGPKDTYTQLIILENALYYYMQYILQNTIPILSDMLIVFMSVRIRLGRKLASIHTHHQLASKIRNLGDLSMQ
jgi:hypothetical protein